MYPPIGDRLASCFRPDPGNREPRPGTSPHEDDEGTRARAREHPCDHGRDTSWVVIGPAAAPGLSTSLPHRDRSASTTLRNRQIATGAQPKLEIDRAVAGVTVPLPRLARTNQTLPVSEPDSEAVMEAIEKAIHSYILNEFLPGEDPKRIDRANTPDYRRHPRLDHDPEAGRFPRGALRDHRGGPRGRSRTPRFDPPDRLAHRREQAA